MTGIFDTHAHYDDEAYNEDREEVLRELPSQGILRVVNIGAGIASCKSTMELMERYDFIYGAMGIHPQETKGLNEEVITWLKEQCGRKKCVAVGEIGLDYYWDEPQRQVQKKWFAKQLALAKEMSLPVVIHSREAAEDTIDIMRAEKAGETGGVIHCYSYSRETARRFLDMGFYFGIGGVLTFKNAKKLKEAAKYIPLDYIVLETDCPYLAPEPNRGKRNSSLNLPYVAAALAQLKGVSEEEVRRAAWENGMRLYRMEQSANS
nr:TatD family hydrolase [uncultured Acetatifactor sp.]